MSDAFQICGCISHSGTNGEPIACGYLPDHEGAHSWGTLPTFVNGLPELSVVPVEALWKEITDRYDSALLSTCVIDSKSDNRRVFFWGGMAGAVGLAHMFLNDVAAMHADSLNGDQAGE